MNAQNRNHRVIDSKTASAFFSTPFNPPDFTDEYTIDEFEDEYWAIYDRVHSVLMKFGEREDVFMNETHQRCRFISVGLLSTELIRPEVLELIEAVIDVADESYFVHVFPETLKVAHFQLGVMKSLTLGWGERKVLEVFALNWKWE